MYPNKILAEEAPAYTEKNKTTFNVKDGDRSTSKKNVRIIEQFKKPETTGKAIVDIRGENIVDRVGNKLDPATSLEQCYYYYDNAKPKITITLTGASGTNYNIDGNGWIREPVTTTVTVTDATDNNIYSGIDMNTFKNSNIGGAKLSDKDENTGIHTYTRVDTNRKQTDTYTVCDKVGNCYSDTVNIKVDTTYPKCTSRDGISDWKNQNITINGDCEDQGNPAFYSDCVKKVYSQTYSAEQSINNATAGQACDNAGNCVICSQDQEVHIDKTKPNCTTDGESTTWATSRTIKFNCEDPVSGGVKSGCTQTTFETITYTSTTRTTSKTWNIKDEAGNTRTCTKSNVEVFMDITDPSCKYVEIGGEDVPGEPIIMTLQCTDDQALQYCGHDEANYEFSNPQKLFNRTLLGSSDVTRTVTDMAGNTGKCSISIAASTCTSSCCGTHDCNCDKNGNCDQCPNKCENDGGCCGYHVAN
jgi:hypothetical protein